MANSYLSSNTGTATNAKKFTYSVWLKRSKISSEQRFYQGYKDSNNRAYAVFLSNDKLRVYNMTASNIELYWDSTRVFRDTNAWYHIVLSADSTQAAQADRFKVYVNGVEETDFTKSYNPGQNIDWGNQLAQTNGDLTISGTESQTQLFEGYMSHAAFVDGTALTPTSFGETESTSGIWKFKSPSGITWGNNGYHLKFENSANLGLDSSGNTNNFTVNGNLVQSIDTPSNIFCTMNPIVSNRSGFTFSNGNLTVNTPSTSGSAANMGVNQGKWYFECLINTLGNFYGGWQDLDNVATNTNSYMVDGTVATNNGPDIYYGTSSSSANSMDGMSQGDYIGFAIDVPNLKCWWSRNGQWYTADSATPTTLTRAQVSANNNGFDLTTGSEMNSSSTITAYMGTSTAATNNSFNFGTGIFGTTKLTGTTYTDDNGVGIFKYEPPAGFRAICTKNINTYG